MMATDCSMVGSATVTGWKRRSSLSLIHILCALAAVFGMYLLCVGSGFSIAYGDLLTLGCAVLFAIHICYVGAVIPNMDGVRLSCVQFFVCSALSAVGMLLFEAPDWGSILQCWWPIVYAGVFSGGVAYTCLLYTSRCV